MSKRKEYLGVAEESMLNVILAYNRDNGSLPDGYTVLKRVFTTAYGKVAFEIRNRIARKLGCKVHKIENDPNFEAAYKDVIKEIEADVRSFRI